MTYEAVFSASLCSCTDDYNCFINFYNALLSLSAIYVNGALQIFIIIIIRVLYGIDVGDKERRI